MKRLLLSFAVAFGVVTMAPMAQANEKLIELSEKDEYWVLPGKNYSAQNYSPLEQINVSNVQELRPAWSFSTGVLHGHEGGNAARCGWGDVYTFTFSKHDLCCEFG